MVVREQLFGRRFLGEAPRTRILALDEAKALYYAPGFDSSPAEPMTLIGTLADISAATLVAPSRGVRSANLH